VSDETETNTAAQQATEAEAQDAAAIASAVTDTAIAEPAATERPSAPAPASEAPTPPVLHPHSEVFRMWIERHVAGGPIGRSTEAFNHLQDALPALSAMLQSGDSKGD